MQCIETSDILLNIYEILRGKLAAPFPPPKLLEGIVPRCPPKSPPLQALLIPHSNKYCSWLKLTKIMNAK